jgi:hypothetical protein
VGSLATESFNRSSVLRSGAATCALSLGTHLRNANASSGSGKARLAFTYGIGASIRTQTSPAKESFVLAVWLESRRG